MHLLTRILAVCALLAATVPLTTTATSADAAATVDPATLALDFGSEWLKGCLANQKASSIGSHLDVVIDSQSARKTPNLLGFDAADERILGDAALSLLFRTPARVFPHVKRLIGRTLQDPVVQQFQRDFPALELSSDAERGTVVFAKKGGDVSVEEVVVMLLQLAQRQAYNHVAANAEPADIQPVKGVVLTVPEHFSSAQRRLFAQLTELAGFEAPKATLGELTAVAIDYAVRNLPIAAEPSKVAFLSAGTMGVSATSFEMQRTESKITIRALKTASDATVGGYSIDLLVRDVLAKRFDASGKAGAASITTNPRAMAKLLRESRDLKEMLSASPVIEVQMAELFGGRDFKTSMTQEELNGLIADLVGKLISPLRTILEGETGVTGIEMFGGSVRTPSVQVAIKSAFPSIPLGKHVDGEESAVIGAAHYAGVLTNIAKLIRVEVDESAVAPQTSDADTKLVLTAEQQRVLGEKIAALDAKAEARRIADAARNTLESTLNDARDLIASGKVPKGKKDELVALESLIAESSTFVEDSDAQTTAAAFNEKHTTLLAALDPLRPVKKAEPTKPEKPSAPRKKRDRRAEYAKAQEEAKRQEKQLARDADKAKAKAAKTKAQDNKKASKETKKVPAKDKKKATKEEEKQRSKSNKRDREEL